MAARDTPNVPDGPASDGFVITPGGSSIPVGYTWFRSLYVGVTGNLTYTTLAGNSVTISNAPVGYHPLAGTAVTAATASAIVGFV
jgi:hypothetical protein